MTYVKCHSRLFILVYTTLWKPCSPCFSGQKETQFSTRLRPVYFHWMRLLADQCDPHTAGIFLRNVAPFQLYCRPLGAMVEVRGDGAGLRPVGPHLTAIPLKT